jgi:hypothetical protein
LPQVDQLGPRGDGHAPSRANFNDPLAPDDHDLVSQETSGTRIEKATRTDGHRLRRLRE